MDTSAREIARGEARSKIREKAGLVSISVRKFVGAVSQRGTFHVIDRQIGWRVSRHEPRIDPRVRGDSVTIDANRFASGEDCTCRSSSTPVKWIDQSGNRLDLEIASRVFRFSVTSNTLVQIYKKCAFFLHLSRVDYTTAFTDCVTVYSNQHTGRPDERLLRSLDLRMIP